ncbi:phage tail protein [Escherichia coli]|nr:phage tail protein [Escherichia coli]
MRDFENSFDAALAGVDRTIVEVMGLCAQFTSGAQCGSEVQGVFDDPESLGFAGSGVRIEGSSPSLFVRTDTVRAVRRGDTLTINGETFWVDRVSPDDGGSCYLWLNRGQPPAVIRKDRCSKCMRGCEMRGMVANFGGFLSINKLSQ